MTEGCHGHGSRSAQASPLTGRLANDRHRIEFITIWDCSFASGCFPPRLTTTQLPSASPPLLGLVEFRFSLTGLYAFMITPVEAVPGYGGGLPALSAGAHAGNVADAFLAAHPFGFSLTSFPPGVFTQK